MRRQEVRIDSPHDQPKSLVSPLKLGPPRAGPNEVARTALCDAALAGRTTRIVLLRAPAGFGKTTVMRQLRQHFMQAGMATAWLKVDLDDNDIGRFVATLCAALAPVMPEAADLSAHPSDVARYGLLEMVAAHEAPFAIFLDKLEALQGSAALNLVRDLAERIPPGSRLIIGSRSIPAIGLSRMRTQGTLRDIEPRNLRFSVAEAGSFMRNAQSLPLSDDDLAAVHARTDGWPAAISLLSLALAGSGDRRLIHSFSGSDEAIATYLTEDVLASLPGPLRRFLLESSVLGDFTAELCNAACGITTARQMLASLQTSNLFLTSLGEAEGQYRYHSLFAEFLRAQLEVEFPGRARDLHIAAAQWYQSQHRPVPAIDHAFASGDRSYALPLLDAHAEHLLTDARMRLLSRWLGSLPPEALRPFPRLQLIYAWVLSFVRRPQDAMQLLDDISAPGREDKSFTDYRSALRPLLLSLMDRPDEAFNLGLATLKSLDQPSDFVLQMLLIALATVQMIRGDFADSRRYIDQARRLQLTSTAMFSVAVLESLEGAMDLLGGRLRQATARLRSALNPRTPMRSHNAKQNAMTGILLAECLYEADELDQAERLLEVYAPAVKDGGLADQIITGHIILARLAGLRKDLHQQFQLLMELEQLGYRLDLRRAVLSARLERARVSLGLGNAGAAALEIDLANEPVFWEKLAQGANVANDIETYEVGLLRLMTRDGRHAPAIPLLVSALARAGRAGRFRRALKLRILLAEALSLGKDSRRALEEIGKAVELAAPEGFLRIFLDEGPGVLRLLRELNNAGNLSGPAGAPLFMARLLRREAAVADVENSAGPAGMEPLTRKEIAVLRLAANGLSNRAIAERLFVSESTVRTHLRNINSKFDVRSRVQAIVAARGAGLIL